jgi:type I restriction enzyme S subunit
MFLSIVRAKEDLQEIAKEAYLVKMRSKNRQTIGWNLVSLGEITVDLIGGGTPSTSKPEYWDGNIPWMTSANLTDRIVLRGMRNITQKGLQNSATSIVPKGSLLISTRVGIGKVGIAGIDIAISQDLTGLVPDNDKANVEYLYWAILNKSSQLSGLSQGSTVKGLTRDYVKNLKVFLPPLSEQNKIAEILSTVDQAIEKVVEAIEKTQRLKKGLMQGLLTKGIGHKEFKETEIGRIPKEWEVMELGEKANVRYGLGQPPALEPNGIPMIRATNVKRGKIVREGLIFLSPGAVPNSRDPFLRVGDILVVRSGAYTGDVGLVTKEWEGAVAGYDLIVTPSDTIDSQFLTYYLLSSSIQKRYFVGLKVRSAQPHLNSSQVEETPIPHPPLPEQQKIAEILSAADERLELLRKRKERLEKIKKGLMNDLLTGRKRVKLN